jgi:hypothetical protein
MIDPRQPLYPVPAATGVVSPISSGTRRFSVRGEPDRQNLRDCATPGQQKFEFRARTDHRSKRSPHKSIQIPENMSPNGKSQVNGAQGGDSNPHAVKAQASETLRSIYRRIKIR